eukprot:1191398-Prorocentrum_minimum.AAC.3
MSLVSVYRVFTAKLVDTHVRSRATLHIHQGDAVAALRSVDVGKLARERCIKPTSGGRVSRIWVQARDLWRAHPEDASQHGACAVH